MQAKFRYCGAPALAPAVALGKGHPAEHNIGDGEDSQAPAIPPPLGGRLAGDANYQLFCMRVAFDAQRALDAQPDDAQVDAAKAHFSHPLPRNAPRKFVKKVPKVVQPITCEVCKMQFNSLVILRDHETGKKHKKNLKKLQDSITPKPENSPNGAVGANTAPAAAVTDAVMPAVQSKKNKRSPATPEDLKVKKRRVLEAGAAQGELENCTMSNVVKKVPKVVQTITCEVCKTIHSLNNLRDHETGKKHKRNLEKQVMQPITCEVCKMQFHSLVILRDHETGKKHKKNLKKLQDSITPKPENSPNGAFGASTAPAAAVTDGVMPAVQSKKNKRSPASPEDLKVKKRRVLEAGAAQGELENCTMSNVVKKVPKAVQTITCEVCKTLHSLNNLRHHETGKKHKRNLEKQVKQPITCEVCKMQFHSLVILRDHETGKKHKKNLEKLQDSITSEPAKPPNSAVGASTAPAAAVTDDMMPAAQPEKDKSSPATPEDLEVKKRRVKVGKKYKKNLKKLQDSITSEPAKPPNGAVGASMAPAADVADGVVPAIQPKNNNSSAASPEDLEAKKRRVLEAGAAQGELKICTMSNVVKKVPKVVLICEVCKTQSFSLVDLRTHETGMRHKKNLEKLQDSIASEPAKPPNGAVGASTAPAAAVTDDTMPAVQPKKDKSSPATPEDLEVKKRRVKVGKKYKKNLKKLQDSITSEPAKPPNGAVGASMAPAADVADGVMPAVQPKNNNSSAVSQEDLEAKEEATD